ncbi:MAG: V-type ATP synthase subunit D [Methanocellales archaeon]|nr:V-type ATP synthase subunit D [Methanocellales archaeon]
MAVVVEGVHPTRMELLKLSRRTKLAEKGHELLREKRDALITEFLDVVEDVRGARKNVEAKLESAFRELTIAQAILGVNEVRQISWITPQEIFVDLDTRNIMGVKVPLIETGDITRSIMQRGYGFVDTSSALDQAAKNFEEALVSIVKLAETEKTAKKLAAEIEKTKRKVNALEYIIVPRLVATTKYITMRLEEMERESFCRLKKIKAVLQRREIE